MATDLMPNPTASMQTPAFAGATAAAEAPFTAGLMPSTTIIAAAMATSMGSMESKNAAGGRLVGTIPTAALIAGGAAALFANL